MGAMGRKPVHIDADVQPVPPAVRRLLDDLDRTIGGIIDADGDGYGSAMILGRKRREQDGKTPKA